MTSDKMAQVRTSEFLDETESCLSELDNDLASAKDAAAKVIETRDRVEDALHRLGAALFINDEPTPWDLVKRVYWQYPDVRVTEIAKAFGIHHAGEVHKLVGSEAISVPRRLW